VNADGEIRTFLARVAQLGDRGPAQAYLAMFREDAVVTIAADQELGTEEALNRGLEAISASLTARRAAGILGPGSDTRHVVTTSVITIDDADHAHAESVFQFFAHASTAPALLSIGAYHDVIMRDADGWRLAQRTITSG
jgi:3-phenylpropionate/cinnamic acid dioxygenase small subunit